MVSALHGMQESWSHLKPGRDTAKATCRLILHACPHVTFFLGDTELCLLGEAHEWAPAPGLWVTFAAKTSQGLWSYTWHQLTRVENEKSAQDVRREFKTVEQRGVSLGSASNLS